MSTCTETNPKSCSDDQLTPESRSALQDGGVVVHIQEEPSHWDGQSFHREVPTKINIAGGFNGPTEFNPLDGFKIAGLPIGTIVYREMQQFFGFTDYVAPPPPPPPTQIADTPYGDL